MNPVHIHSQFKALDAGDVFSRVVSASKARRGQNMSKCEMQIDETNLLSRAFQLLNRPQTPLDSNLHHSM